MHTSNSNLIVLVSEDEEFKRQAALQFKLAVPAQFTFLLRNPQDALKLTESETPWMILIDVNGKGEGVCSFVQKIADHYQDAKIVCAGAMHDAALVVKLVKAGAKDFLKLPFDHREIKTLLESNFGAHSRTHTGSLVTVCSPKGGAGVSLLTANLAVALAKKSRSHVASCELSPQCGDMTTYLNTNPQYTIRDLIDNVQRLDLSFLKGVMLSHPSGVKILASPREDQEPLSANCLTELQSIFALLRQSFDIVLIDGSHTDNTLLQLALMQSDLIFLIANLDVPSLKGLIFSLNKLTKLHYDHEKIKIVMNRTNSKNQLDVREFEKKAHHEVASRLPNNYALCIEAINTGRPLSEIQSHAELTKKIGDLAAIVWETAKHNHFHRMNPAEQSVADQAGLGAAVKGFVKCLF